jgi:hypothetical protein
MDAFENLNFAEIRETNLRRLGELGFRSAEILTGWTEHLVLRPPVEIARRLMALDVLFTWIADDETETERVLAYERNNGLRDAMTDEEREQFDTDREEACEEWVDTIGWRLENMWALAWVLGFDPAPEVDAGMIPPEITKAMLLEFLPGLGKSVDDLLAKSNVRSNADVVRMHDLYYRAHNAVRSAQLGRDTVPAGFHPVVDGGTVHERRHALTWSLSPGVAWDETELGT